ncbi:integrator complex subunit 8-like [Branchiostoma floridae]|uniref:Integrator complex subunit 8-like n=1 Tax=Branchiostoma floridae TaxID=7739 RepID=C3ZBT2_BRAFL|nr:integrator complex subunit 8-like [Branchiostoma floridae]XP_035680272.1 integrator complex subunit 8-like [Branchiostoma floridae]|eukprot:XP_002594308.1 hypothetical protein BRAFLDRAFT_117675 [Branchiostoma floridae]
MMNDPDAERPRSRSQSPLPPAWFEFLLDPSLLSKHLSTESPDPSASQLIVQFLDQATRTMVNEQNQILPPADNKRNRALRHLALQAAAHLRWDLNQLETSLSNHHTNLLLNELLRVARSPTDVKHTEIDLASIPDYTTIALVLYHRWAIRVVVSSSFPVKPVRTFPNNMLGTAQAAGEIAEALLKVLRDQLPDSVCILENCVALQRPLHLPTVQSLGDPEEGVQEGGLLLSTEDITCQVQYDLGTLYFHQHEYQKALKSFTSSYQLIKELSDPIFCKIDVPKLEGYLSACQGLAGIAPSVKPSSLFDEVEQSRKSNYKGLLELLVRDNLTAEVPTSYRHFLEQELEKKTRKEDKLQDTWLKVCCCNAVSNVVQGRPVQPSFTHLVPHLSQDMVHFLIKICKQSVHSTDQRQHARMVDFIGHVLRHMSGSVVLESVLETSKDLLTTQELETIRAQYIPQQTAIPNYTGERPHTNTGSRQQQQCDLEQALMNTLSPKTIQRLVMELHGMATDSAYCVPYHKWEMPREYVSFLWDHHNSVGSVTHDVVYLILAKALHCASMKDFPTARVLLRHGVEQVRALSFRLGAIVHNELLLLDITDHASRRDGRKAAQELVQAVKNQLSTRIPEVPVRKELHETMAAFLLNIREFEYLFQSRNTVGVYSNSYLWLAHLIASVSKDLPMLKSFRQPGRELWDFVVSVFVDSHQHKRGSDGKAMGMMQRDSAISPLTRTEFLDFLKNIQDPVCLSLMVSCLAKIINILQDDSNKDVSNDYATLWPQGLGNHKNTHVSDDSVALVLRELLGHALSINPGRPSWLKTQADLSYAAGQYSAALRFYLQAGMVCSDYFTHQVPKGVYDEQVYKRMIKCCKELQCHTHVAVLCQFLKEVDYSTAFKVLQERNSYDAMDDYYDYFWDVDILEYLVNIHTKKGELDKRQAVLQVLGQQELNSSNSEDVLIRAANARKSRFFRILCKMYV